MTPLQRRIYLASALCGGALTLLVVLLEATNMLQPLEWWLYDLRARTCQFSMPPPTDKIVHIDIDDASLVSIGRWPWSRNTMAGLLDEIRLAGPIAVGIDVLYTDPQFDTTERRPDGTEVTLSQDGALAESFRKLGNVVLPASLRFATASKAPSPIHLKAVQLLASDLTLTREQLVARLTPLFQSEQDLAAQIELDYTVIRGEAVRNRVRERLLGGPVPLETLQSELLPPPPTTAAATPVRLERFVEKIIEEQYHSVVSELAFQRFAVAVPPSLRLLPPDGSMNEPPLPEFSRAAAACGFADYNVFSEPVVRVVPLFIRTGDHLYPQFAFVMACQILGVPIGNVRIEDNAVTIPADEGAIRIPVRSRYSKAVGRRLGSIMDIPWFGGANWATMYDWPEYNKIVRHYPMNVVYDIVEVKRRIEQNNRLLDRSILYLLDPLEAESRAAARYAANKPLPGDYASRRKVAEDALKELKESGYDELIKRPDREMTEYEREIRNAMLGAPAILAQSDQHISDLEAKRQGLKKMIGDKGVLIGSVATASGDVITSSLHSRCPGVVVHGVLINAILKRHFLTTAPPWMNLLLTLLLGIATTALTSWLPPARAVLLAMLLAIAYFTINGLILFDRFKLIVDAAAPIVVILMCWGGGVVVRLVIEGLERIRIQRERAVIEHEISLARQVQASLIPKQLNILTNVESHGWTLAATTTGGDCFDLWKLADGRLGILVADASGHGLGPSIIVSEVRALVRALCDIAPEPQKLLERVNFRLASDLQGSKFCTAFVGFLSEDGQMSWGSAGHGPMLWSPTPTGEPHELEGTGLPLGVSEDWFGDETVPILSLEEKGWLIAISDGIFEAPDPRGEQFGTDRVKQILREYASESCETIVAKLRDAVHKWQVVSEPADDQTIVLVRRSTGHNTPQPAGPPL